MEYPHWDPLNIYWSFIHERHRSHTCPDCDLQQERITFSFPQSPSSQSSPVHFNGVKVQRRGRICCSGCRRLVNGTRCQSGAWSRDGEGGAGKPRPPSVALCAAIGEPSKGDCTTDGHLQATMIPFVQPLPPPLHIKLLFIYLFSTDRMGFMTKCSSGDIAAGLWWCVC